MAKKSVVKYSLSAAVVACAMSYLSSGTVVLALPSAVSSSFEEGVKLYSQKQYKQALPVFMQFLKANPRSSAAYLYIANSYYALQQVGPAKQTYQVLIQSFPNSSEARAAREFLIKLQPPESANAKDNSATAEGSTSIPKAFTKRLNSPSPVGELTFRVVRPIQDHPAVSTQLINDVKSRLQSYPKQVRRLLYENGIEVVLTPTLIDKNPEMKNQEGRGYDGHTLKSCPGMFQDGRMIVICERTMDEGTEAVHEPISTSSILRTLNHETGHAIDRCLGELCETEEFKHAYLLDAAAAQRLDASISRDLAYYLQKSVAGQQECCGELFGIILGTDDDKSEKMKTAFPQTIKYLKAKLGV